MLIINLLKKELYYYIKKNINKKYNINIFNVFYANYYKNKLILY